MEYFAGIDVSLEQSSICVVDAAGSSARPRSRASLKRCSSSSADRPGGWPVVAVAEMPPADDGARCGAVVAVTFKSAVDDPRRFVRSRILGAYFGLTPKKYQSGETDVTGGISRVGDAMVRTALYEAANVMLTRAVRFSTRKRWAMEAAKRRGMKRAKVALARKLAIILHRLWVDGTGFC